MYCCSRETGRELKNEKAFIRVRDGIYTIRFINPGSLDVISETEFDSKGLRSESEIALPDFTDDLLIELSERSARKKSLIEGTQ
jgi:hypothetical protein